jgi:phosphatidylserine/phosphatidylglycerophosphate/cardiolipin synthase-like enzyme
MSKKTNTAFEVYGKNAKAPFTLKAYRGEGLVLLAMNWKADTPPINFVGFSIEYKEPNGERFFSVANRINFLDKNGKAVLQKQTSLQSPIQKFRWVHYPRNPYLPGEFEYKVKPVFMDNNEDLSYGASQTISINISNETYSNQLNIAFTRGFIMSQAFVDRYLENQKVTSLIPSSGKTGLTFTPTHPYANEAYSWMGLEARQTILDTLNNAVKDKTAKVFMICYDFNLPELLTPLKKLGKRLTIIIDDSGEHKHESAETEAATILMTTTGGKVKRHHMSKLQHNKVIIVNGKEKIAIGGSTNFTWRGFYVQSNNAVVIKGAKAIQPFLTAFDHYWQFDSAKDFGNSTAADWHSLQLKNIDASVTFSPHGANNKVLPSIAADLTNNTKSNIFYSLAFLYQTPGVIFDGIEKLTNDKNIFAYGISDRKTGGIDIQKPNGNVLPVYATELSTNLPLPFKAEPKRPGVGNSMHHKFIVLDFNLPTARVYTGSYNFSKPADNDNGENLFLIKDRKITVSYMIEALKLFDHYHFRVAVKEAKTKKEILHLKKPPKLKSEKSWWQEHYTDQRKINDRILFSK